MDHWTSLSITLEQEHRKVLWCNRCISLTTHTHIHTHTHTHIHTHTHTHTHTHNEDMLEEIIQENKRCWMHTASNTNHSYNRLRTCHCYFLATTGLSLVLQLLELLHGRLTERPNLTWCFSTCDFIGEVERHRWDPSCRKTKVLWVMAFSSLLSPSTIHLALKRNTG